MCILIHQPAGFELTDEHFADFFKSNPDGFGAIVKHGSSSEVIKHVGKLAEMQKLYRDHVMGHEAIIHMRWKTHGDVNLDNCHPYEVVDGVYMAHNGVLSTGNTADPSRSDTWHYIQNYLRPLLLRDPDLIHEQAFQSMISGHIGSSNKFGFMDATGEVVLINRSSGIEHEGIWYSNTYAWTPSKFGYKPQYTGYSTYNGYQRNQYSTNSAYKPLGYEDDDSWESKYQSAHTATSKVVDMKAKSGNNKKAKAKKARRTVANTKANKEEQLSIFEDVVCQTPQGTIKLPEYFSELGEQAYKNLLCSVFNEIVKDDLKGVVRWTQANEWRATRLLAEFYPMTNVHKIHALVRNHPYDAAQELWDYWLENEWEIEDTMGITSQPYKGADYATN